MTGIRWAGLAVLCMGAYVTYLTAAVTRGQLARFEDAQAVLRQPISAAVWMGAAALTAATLAGWVAWGRRPDDRTFGALVALGVAGVGLCFLHPLGRHGGFLLLSLAAGLGAGALAGQWQEKSARSGKAGGEASEPWIAAGLYIGTWIPMAFFSMRRHWSFGSGSWDLGCEVHNAYRTSRFLPTVSTVLGDVDFIGDHFLVGFYLYAPFFWLWTSAYAVLFLQASNLAVVSAVVFAVARRHGASLTAAAALGGVTGLSFGLQAAAFFDAHEITLGFGFFAGALYALETRRWGWAVAALMVFSLFKESVGLYIVGLGLWVVLRSWANERRLSGVRPDDRRTERWVGSGLVAYGLICFAVVNRVLMPMFRANGNPPEPHETFQDFGPDVFSAAVAMLSDPLRSAWVMLAAEMKLESLVVTLANSGWLALLAPSVGVAALPLLAERFLSSKLTMWQMGYHYAAPLCLYAGWAAARRLGAVEALLRERLPKGRRFRVAAAAAAFLLSMGGWVTLYGTYEPSNFWVWRYPYYSTPEKREANRAAVNHVLRQGADARVAAQNRLLPHLAARKVIYRLGDYPKTDWVVLSEGESAWPYPPSFPSQIRRRLQADAGWVEAFHQRGTYVFQRRGGDRPPDSVAE